MYIILLYTVITRLWKHVPIVIIFLPRNFLQKSSFYSHFCFSNSRNTALKNGANAQQWKTCHYFAQTMYYNIIICSFAEHNIKSHRKEGGQIIKNKKMENVQSSPSASPSRLRRGTFSRRKSSVVKSLTGKLQSAFYSPGRNERRCTVPFKSKLNYYYSESPSKKQPPPPRHRALTANRRRRRRRRCD